MTLALLGVLGGAPSNERGTIEVGPRVVALGSVEGDGCSTGGGTTGLWAIVIAGLLARRRRSLISILCCVCALVGVAEAQPALRRVASAGDVDLVDATRTFGSQRELHVGSSGFIVYRTETESAFGSEQRAQLMADDHGERIVIAKPGDTFHDGRPYQDVGDFIAIAGTLVAFEAISTTPVLATWDAARGLRTVIAVGDPMPSGTGTVAGFTAPVVNEAGQLMVVVTSSNGFELTLVEADGTKRMLMRRGQTVPGAATHTVVNIGTYFLAEDGAIAFEAIGFDPANTQPQTFIFAGGAVLGLEAASVKTPELIRDVRLIAMDPMGDIAYAIAEQDLTIPGSDNNTQKIQLGSPGSTATILTLTGQNVLDFGGGHRFDGRVTVQQPAFLRDGQLAITEGALVVQFRSGAWSLVAANDQVLPGETQPALGVRATGMTATGQIAVETQRGVWRFTPGAGLLPLAITGMTFDTGASGMRVSTDVFETGIDDAGDVLFAVNWRDDNNNNQTSVFTTQVTTDLAITTVAPSFAVFSTTSFGFSVLVTIRNAGGQPVRDLTIALENPSVAVSNLSDDCLVVELGCRYVEELAPGEETTVELLYSLVDRGTFTGAIHVTTEGDADATNDIATFEVEIENPTGGCSTSGAASPWLIALALFTRRGRARASARRGRAP